MRIVLHLGLSVGLTVLAARTFLFGDGYLLFQNWNWPIALNGNTPAIQSVFDVYAWGNWGGDPAGYTRAVTSSPPILFWWTHNPILLEKVFVVYAFLVEYFLALVAACLLVRWLFPSASAHRRLAVELCFVFLMLVNPAALQWEAGMLVPFMWGAPLIAIAIFATALGTHSNPWRYGLVAGLALGIGATLDPRLLVWGLGAVALFLVMRSLLTLSWRRQFLLLVRVALFALPGALLTYYAYAWVGVSSGASLRTGSVTAISQVSGNSGFANIFVLLGYYISGITYAPPTILAQTGAPSTLPSIGTPVFMVLPGGPVTTAWLFALWVLPLLACSSLLIQRRRSVTIPLATIMFVSLAFAAGTTSPFEPLVHVESAIGNIRLGGLGGIWQTVIGVPSYIQLVTESIYVTLAVLTLATVYEGLTRVTAPEGLRLRARAGGVHIVVIRGPQRGSRRPSRIPAVAAILLVAAVGFGSWQFFSGDFYPAGLSPGVSADGVPATGAYQPVAPPIADQDILEYLDAHPSNGTIFWPGPDSFAYNWNPKWSPPLSEYAPRPVKTVPGITTVVGENASGELLPLLQYFGVAYAVVDNMSASALNWVFGVDSVSSVVSLFESTRGISCVLCLPPDAWLFEVANPTGLVEASGAVADPIAQSSVSLPPVVATLAALGGVPTFAQSAAAATQNVSFGFPVAPVPVPGYSVVTAANLSLLLPSRSLRAFPGEATASATLPLPTTGDFTLPRPYGNWTASVWSLGSADASLNVSAGENVSIASPGGPSLISLNYLSSLVDGSRMGIPVSPAGSVSFNASVQVRGSPGAAGTTALNVVVSNSAAENTVQFYSSWVYSASGSTQVLNLTGQLPSGSSLFTVRVFTNVTGAVALTNLSLQWSEVTPSSSSASGAVVSLANGTFQLGLAGPVPNLSVGVQTSGGGTVTACAALCQEIPLPTAGNLTWSLVPDLPAAGAAGLRLTFDGNPVVGSMAVTSVPGGFGPSQARVVYSSVQISSIEGSVESPGYFLRLQASYAPSWRLVLDGGGPSAGRAEQFGGIFFSLPPGNHTFALSLDGIAAQPWLLILWGGVTLLMIVCAFRPRVPGRLVAMVRDRVTGTKGSTGARRPGASPDVGPGDPPASDEQG